MRHRFLGGGGGLWHVFRSTLLFREVLKGDLEALAGKLIMAVKQREDTLKKYKAVEAVLKGYEEECAKLLAVSSSW